MGLAGDDHRRGPPPVHLPVGSQRPRRRPAAPGTPQAGPGRRPPSPAPSAGGAESGPPPRPAPPWGRRGLPCPSWPAPPWPPPRPPRAAASRRCRGRPPRPAPAPEALPPLRLQRPQGLRPGCASGGSGTSGGRGTHGHDPLRGDRIRDLRQHPLRDRAHRAAHPAQGQQQAPLAPLALPEGGGVEDQPGRPRPAAAPPPPPPPSTRRSPSTRKAPLAPAPGRLQQGARQAHLRVLRAADGLVCGEGHVAGHRKSLGSLGCARGSRSRDERRRQRKTEPEGSVLDEMDTPGGPRPGGRGPRNTPWGSPGGGAVRGRAAQATLAGRAISAMRVKAAASRTARSASIFRSTDTLARRNPSMKRL